MDISESVKLNIDKIIKETDKAWNVKIGDSIEWLPKSQCRIINNHIYIPRWICDAKGIFYEQMDIE